jgi:hypothetical protein
MAAQRLAMLLSQKASGRLEHVSDTLALYDGLPERVSLGLLDC